MKILYELRARIRALQDLLGCLDNSIVYMPTKLRILFHDRFGFYLLEPALHADDLPKNLAKYLFGQDAFSLLQPFPTYIERIFNFAKTNHCHLIEYERLLMVKLNMNLSKLIAWKEAIVERIATADAELAANVHDFLREIIFAYLFVAKRKAECADRDANRKFGAYLTQWVNAPDAVHLGAAFGGSLANVAFCTLQNEFISQVLCTHVKSYDAAVALVSHCRRVSNPVFKFESRGNTYERASVQTGIAC